MLNSTGVKIYDTNYIKTIFIYKMSRKRSPKRSAFPPFLKLQFKTIQLENCFRRLLHNHRGLHLFHSNNRRQNIILAITSTRKHSNVEVEAWSIVIFLPVTSVSILYQEYWKFYFTNKEAANIWNAKCRVTANSCLTKTPNRFPTHSRCIKVFILNIDHTL